MINIDHDVINYYDRYIVLNNCQLNYKKSLLKANEIAKIETPKATYIAKKISDSQLDYKNWNTKS